MQKNLRIRFLILSWGLLMILLSALCGGIALYLYHTEVQKSEDTLKAGIEEFMTENPAHEYTQSGKGLLLAAYSGNGRLYARRAWHMSMSQHNLDLIVDECEDGNETGSGRIEFAEIGYRYQYVRQDINPEGQILLAVTDCTQEERVKYTIRHNILWFLILGGLLLIPVSILLSQWASRPIEEAWEKQNDFVSDATHELKTPLATIAADTEAVLSNPEATVESQSKWLGSIQGETSRMAGLISGLLFLAKIDAGEIKLTLKEEEISERMEELCMEWEPTIYEADRRFDYEMTGGLLYKCDWSRIRQMVDEIVDNAVKYSKKGGRIRLVMNRDRKQHLRIVVSNEGDPIDEKDLENIFDRFYRIDQSRARITGGYGLGLCVARCIAELHGGSITAESYGGINVFTVLLGEPEGK